MTGTCRPPALANAVAEPGADPRAVQRLSGLFPRVDTKASPPAAGTLAAPASAEGAPARITIDDFKRVDLRVAEIVAAEPVPIPSGTTSLTASLGAAIGNGPSIDADELIRVADEALYRAKRAGRNRVEAAFHAEAPAPSP